MKHNITTTTPQTMTCAELDTYVKAHLGLRTTLTEPETVNTNPPFPLTQDTHLPTQITTPDGIYTDTKQKLQAKGINVTGTEYVRILDDAVREILLANVTHAEEGKISKAEAALVTSLGRIFINNQNIQHVDLTPFINLNSIASAMFGDIGDGKDACKSLKYFNSGCVSSLPYHMFPVCGLEELVIPNVTYFGDGVIYNNLGSCSTIKKVYVTSIEQWLKISYYGIRGVIGTKNNYSLYLIDSPNTPLGTSTTPLTIPKTITQINSYALYNLQSVTNLHYAGTSEEWANVTLGTSPFYNLGTSVIHCDGDNVDVAISTT